MSCVGCGLPQDPGNCGFNASSEVRYFFNATSGQCQQFEYAEGCSGNGNNFETMQKCQDTCRELARTVTSLCSLSSINLPIHQPIHPSIHQPIHSSIHQPTHPSIYLFINLPFILCAHPSIHIHLSIHACKHIHTPLPPPIPHTPPAVLRTAGCVLPSDPGPCEAYMPMYFHNATSGRCEMFVYGGCQGNDNRFTTLELCQQACGRLLQTPSLLCMPSCVVCVDGLRCVVCPLLSPLHRCGDKAWGLLSS